VIEDLVELAFAHEIVCAVMVGPDGCDEYALERAGAPDTGGPPIAVRVRPDGRFSRATSAEGFLSLGQVSALCGLDQQAERRGQWTRTIADAPQPARRAR
jgi:hypothetical protein